MAWYDRLPFAKQIMGGVRGGPTGSAQGGIQGGGAAGARFTSGSGMVYSGGTPPRTEITLDPAQGARPTTFIDTGGATPGFQDRISAYSEAGSTGLRRHGGYVYEEILRELAGYRAIRVYKEMAENEPVVGALLFAIEMLIRTVDWDVKPAGVENEHLLAARHVKQCMEDMSHSWIEFIIEALSMIRYGFSYHELVYKIRQGESKDPDIPTSRFNDGAIGWRKIPIRAQDSLLRWEFDSSGGVRAMIQLPPPDYTLRRIPIEKALLFRPKVHKNSPEGYSVLRNAYVPWYFKKTIQRIEAIGIERDLAGLPTLGVPPGMLAADASPENKAALQAYQRMLTSMRRDEGEGFIYPLAYDKDGRPLYELKLLSTGGRRQFDTSSIIARYNQEIAITALADFVLVGHGSQGSGGGKGATAMVENKTEIFSSALGAWLDTIAEVFNRYAIPRLFELNGWPSDKLPLLTHGQVEQVNLDELGNFVANMAKAGAPMFPDDELENVLRSKASLPEKPVDEDNDDELEDYDIQSLAEMHQAIPSREKKNPAAQQAQAAQGTTPPQSAKPNGAAGPPQIAKPGPPKAPMPGVPLQGR